LTGTFITFEGIDGSGKSTQARRLNDQLRGLGYSTVLTREPGGSPGAEEIRRLIIEGPADRWSPETEILLFMAARRDHIERTVRPALARGDIVVSDRFADSTRVYQGATRGDLRALVNNLHDLVIGLEPDLTIIVDMEPRDALARTRSRQSGTSGAPAEDRFESMGLAFQEKLRSGFLEIAKTYPDRCAVISGVGSADEVQERIWLEVQEKISRT